MGMRIFLVPEKAVRDIFIYLWNLAKMSQSNFNFSDFFIGEKRTFGSDIVQEFLLASGQNSYTFVEQFGITTFEHESALLII